jgi:formate dehydrogenase subunit gamma
MSTVPTIVPGRHADTAIVTARTKENVYIGEEIVRHRRASRMIHWGVAASFVLALMTGMPIWTPLFAWMANIVGGLQVARLIHPYISLVFIAFIIAQFIEWQDEMKMTEHDKGWLGPKLFQYLRYEDESADTGKYNGGQKLFFYATTVGAVLFVASGVVMWFPESFPKALRLWAVILHDLTFIGFIVGVIAHIYLGTAAEPGTFRSMTVGTVTRSWAKLHHPGWYRDIMAEEGKKSSARVPVK